MSSSVVITTYNAPRELDLVLEGVSRQSAPPTEVLVADDGSADETRGVVAGWAGRLAVPLHHVWQDDLGRRKCRIVNEAVRRSTGDILVFLDGDSIPHRHWLADHGRSARPGRVLCGRRVRLGPGISARIKSGALPVGRLELPFGAVARSALVGETHRALLGIRLPVPLARLFHPRSRKLMGVNFSVSREAYERVNGYDEAYDSYGFEDYDLEIRLRRAGYDLYPLLNRAVVYHLHHPMSAFTDDSRKRLLALAASSRIRCEQGLAPHEGQDGRDRDASRSR
ncbi:MAG: glycosyltransferase [Acidobacteriia bacterium]|nr:glycosyltransferase [Terriglobia bacterium]